MIYNGMHISAILLVIALIAACDGNPKVIADDPVVLTSSPSELVFDSAGGTLDLSITSDTKPAVTCSDSWVSVTSGDYSGNILKASVTVSANDDTKERSSSIRVIGNKQSLMIPLKQKVESVKLSSDVPALDFTCAGGSKTFTVTSSLQPEVVCNSKWCTVSAGEIDSSRQTVFTVDAAGNRTSSARTAYATVKCGDETLEVKISQPALSITSATASAITPEIVFNKMRMGWDLGNHMDAYSNGVASETAWGNSKCTQALFDAVKAAGMSTVRICVTWLGHIGPAPAYRLDEKWLSRVEEIVGYAEKAGLNAIVNTHHDECNNNGNWQDILSASKDSAVNEQIKDELFCIWAQIAERFKDKGEWLIFEPYNEIQDGGWGWSSTFRTNPDPQYKALNEWAQTFVDAVRCTGGNNSTRWLGIPGYAANPSFTIKGLVLPTDYTSGNRLIVAVHDYDPYNYTLNDPLVRQWGHTADKDKRCSDTDEQNVVDVFDQLKAAYLDKGIPVYIGEMGCSRHEDEDFPYQKYYIEYFCKAAADRLLPMMVWDNGNKGVGSETHAYFDHGTGKFSDDKAEELVNLMLKAVNTTSSDYTLQSVYDSAPTAN